MMLDLPEWLFAYLMQMPKEKIIEVMSDALDQMQAYNRRTMAYCIVSSIEGATCTETDDGYKFTLPKIVDKS